MLVVVDLRFAAADPLFQLARDQSAWWALPAASYKPLVSLAVRSGLGWDESAN